MDKKVESLVRATETISGSFMKLKFVTIACLVCTFLTAAVCVIYSLKTYVEQSNKIYVLDKGQVLTASRQDAMLTREDEARKVSEDFHHLFFDVTPNREVVQEKLENAFRLCADRSAYDYYNDVQESGFYRRITQNQSVQDVSIDSVLVDTKSYPYRVATFSKLYITRASVIVQYNLITRMNMIDVPRDPSNLNGLKIEHFQVVKNEKVAERKRN